MIYYLSIFVFAWFWFSWRTFLTRLFSKHPLSVLPGPAPESWWSGSLFQIVDSNGWDYLKRVTHKYGGVFQFTGILQEKHLFVYDPKALQRIFVKDDHTFVEPNEFILLKEILFGKGLLSTSGDHHRRQKKMLSPVFSVGQIREMLPTFSEVGEKLRAAIHKQVSEGPKEIDMLSWMSRTALELIGQGGFGYSFDTLEKGSKEHPFSKSIKNLVGTANDGWIQAARVILLPTLSKIGTAKFQRAVVDAVPWKNLHELRDMVDVLNHTSVEIFEEAKRALENGDELAALRVGKGKDIMSILLKENIKADAEDRLPDDELLAQISTLTFAGMDTTSNALSRILQLLTEHPDVQAKLREEIQQANRVHAGELDYDTLIGLPYLDAVCRESLRLYSPSPLVTRTAAKDAMLPLSKPVITADGKEVNEIFVPKGTQMFISILYCNRNPDIWGPDALEWKPERWLSPLPSSVIDSRVPGIYSHQMTFLAGGRSCLGLKFSQLEMKIVLNLLLQSFQFSPSGKKIEWRMNGIIQPTTENSPLTSMGHKKLELPLLVSLL